MDNKLLENLNPEERELALKILNDISKGDDKSFNELIYSDYDEIPVDIETFLKDKRYLGTGLINEEGKFTVFPYWVKVLKDVFPNNIDTKYRTLVLSGAIGLGKSFVAVLCILYQLYRMMCLRDPYTHYGLQPIDKITFSIMNITMDAAQGVAWDKLQQLLQTSPWFMQHGKISGRDNLEWQPPKGIELIYGSQPRHVIGRAIFSSFEDEVSFQINKDVEEQKRKAKELISSIDARMQSRFMKGEHLPTLHILASSKRTEQSFLETYIEGKKKNESKTTLIIDEPQWVIRTDKDSPNKFYVAVGNKFMDSEVLPLGISESDLQIYLNKGYTLLQVPMGYREQFVDDIDIALTDIAGISTSSTTRYISGPRLLEIKNRDLKNPFTKDIIEVGDGDDLQYSDFFDMSLVPKDMIYKPLFIHLDMSISGDKTGIAGVWIKGKKPTQEGVPSSKELYYQLAFSVSVKAPKGYQISFEKNRQFIRWLKDQGFYIRSVSSDSFQSAQIMQMLKAEGFETTIISVDRVDSESRMCLPYQTLKSAIYEKRLEIYDSKLLTEELVGLERDNNGRIDHSPAGINSKDSADGLCLHPDTEIFLLSGKHKTIKQLYEDYSNEWVLGYNTDTCKIEPIQIQGVINKGFKDDLIKLTFDTGKTLICTKDHKILCKDGSYEEAKNCMGKSLMSFAYENKIKYSDRDYTYEYNPNADLTCTGIYLHELVTEVYNHRVTNIEKVDGSEVYDLRLDKIHNFALTSGVFVHNCGATYNASQYAEEFAYDYGESYEVMNNVTSSGQEFDKKQITVSFEEELKKSFGNGVFKDFGQGSATTDYTISGLRDGILVF